jgi:hypothetical protein
MHGLPALHGQWRVDSETAQQLKMTQQFDGIDCCTVALG